MAPMLVQSLALMQWRAGRLQEAREIFQEAVTNCPPHAPLWAAWANVEVRDDLMISVAVDAGQAIEHESMLCIPGVDTGARCARTEIRAESVVEVICCHVQ